MNISVICVGKLKERYWSEAIAEYCKRLKSYCNLEIVELKESRLPDKSGPAEEKAVKETEGEEILKKIKDGMYVVTLEVNGRAMSSEKLAEKIEKLTIDGISTIAFVIGGSLGLSEAVSCRADLQLSFSQMTFPHQMMRVILLEQIYRSFKIIRNETYHK